MISHPGLLPADDMAACPTRAGTLAGAVMALALFIQPAAAQDKRVWTGAAMIGDSYVHLHAPTVPNAAATVTFKNTTVHSMDDRFELTFEGITIEAFFDWQWNDTHAERLTVIPPPGYVAVPSEIIVDEDATDQIHIYEYLGG